VKVTIKLKGSDQLLRALNALGDKVNNVADAAVGSGAQLIVNEWKRLAPYRTGTYRRSIVQEPGAKTKTLVTRLIGTLIQDPPYPYFLEFGTSKMPPHPSMRPAWDSKVDDAVKEIERALREALK
jgi:HK97 gp10 family phage protein